MSVLLGLDTETTGIDVAVDKPVQIGMVVASPGGLPRVVMNTRSDPCRPIDPGASRVHGIFDKDVKNMPDYRIAAWNCKLMAAALRPDYLVTFNGKLFDVPLLNNSLGEEVFPGLKHIDVLDVAYRYFPGSQQHKLGYLYSEFMAKSLEGAHDAMNDIIGMLELLETMRVKIGMSIEDLATDMETPKPYSIMPISKNHKGKLLSEVPVSFAKWLLDQNVGKEMRPDLRLSMELVVAGKV